MSSINRKILNDLGQGSITTDLLIKYGFSPIMFAPIYMTRESYFLGKLDMSTSIVVEKPKWYEFWKKEKTYCLMNNLNWQDTTLLIGETIACGVYKDYWSGEVFRSIDDIFTYCRNNGITMTSNIKK